MVLLIRFTILDLHTCTVEDFATFHIVVYRMPFPVQQRHEYTNNIKAEIGISLCILFTKCKIEHSICFPVSSFTRSLLCHASAFAAHTYTRTKQQQQ